MVVERLEEKEARKYLADWESWRNGEQESPPCGMYWYKSEIGGKAVYNGIDNSDGDCWTECFETMAELMKWFEGDSDE